MDEKAPTQQTQPKKGEPITIPVPTRGEIDDALAAVSRPIPPKPKKRHPKVTQADSDGARNRARQRSGEDD